MIFFGIGIALASQVKLRFREGWMYVSKNSCIALVTTTVLFHVAVCEQAPCLGDECQDLFVCYPAVYVPVGYMPITSAILPGALLLTNFVSLLFIAICG